MKNNFYLIIVSALFIFTACEKEGRVNVENKIHNAKLESVSWYNRQISYSLLTGENSGDVTFRDDEDNFPKIRRKR